MTKIDWIGLRRWFFAVSGALVAASVAAIAVKGFNYGIEFTGGMLLQVTFERPLELSEVRDALSKRGFAPEIQSSAEAPTFIFRQKGAVSGVDAAAQSISAALKEAFPSNPLRLDRREFIGPVVGRHLKTQAMKAIVLALLAIIGYVAVRFQNPLWGAAGVAAIAHDVLITAGVFAGLGIEVDLVIVAAFLTIAGYTINDTIVIFDRMRENLRHRRGADIGAIINDSVNEMKGRTLITNSMVLAVVVALYALGGPVIHNFALAMVVGAIVGTYSTVAISTQLVYQWTEKRPARPEPKPRAASVKRA